MRFILYVTGGSYTHTTTNTVVVPLRPSPVAPVSRAEVSVHELPALGATKTRLRLVTTDMCHHTTARDSPGERGTTTQRAANEQQSKRRQALR